ncbi:pyruvoyl-dependent arginine decarboxylase [Desulfothermobacter acidiphilus]|uniref:pyruvoyl-dependent arginine decarboxylase n=1 Tax=Desulfothermobacter acidiphilus TaxID=1938353 RepID=UPI003F8CD7E8
MAPGLPTPKKYFVTAGAAEGATPLNAFDNALLAARIGNVNLIRVSSILPPGTEYDPQLQLPPGSLVPTAYGYIISTTPGEIISAACGVGISRESFGVIMEFSGKCTAQEARDRIERMVREAFEHRGMELADIKIEAVEHQVQRVACALAAVPLWY